ncbi:hypothetical protein Hanom_Chr16g01430501 [Helianthus anomalus]
MTNISVFYVNYHVVFYIHRCTMVCLKFLRSVRVWILCSSDLHYVICGGGGGVECVLCLKLWCFMTLYTL